MKSKIIDIYYFSGTGNTLLIVKEMEKIFRLNKYETNLYKIEKSDLSKVNLNHTLGFAFPVAFQSTYKFIWSRLGKLPDTHSTEAFMVDTMSMFSGGVIGPMKKLFKLKGYKTIGAKEIIMPSNFKKNPVKESKKQKIIAKGLKTARRYAHDLIFDMTSWHRIPVLSDTMKKVSKSKPLWNYMHKKFYPELDEYKCIKCGICFRLCPVDNIKMVDYPEFGNHCQYCQRCVSFCPEDAISFQGIKIAKYRAVNPNQIL